MYTLEINNIKDSSKSERHTKLSEEDVVEIIAKYFNRHEIKLHEYLANEISLGVIDEETGHQHGIQVFHILFDPVIIKDSNGKS